MQNTTHFRKTIFKFIIYSQGGKCAQNPFILQNHIADDI